MSIGLVASLLGAFCQALNYVFTQKCQQATQLGTAHLVVAVHLGLGCIALVPFVGFGFWQYLTIETLKPLMAINLPYFAAQAFLIQAIQRSDASIVSPLLALKIPVLAVLSIILFTQSLSLQQGLAILSILSLALYLSRSAGTLDWMPMLLVLASSFGYALSDIAITDFSKSLTDLPLLEQVLVTISINYAFCGVLSLFAALYLRLSPLAVYEARWVAISWLVAVILLVIGFSSAGVLQANIAQSLRGVFGIALSYMLLRDMQDRAGSSVQKKLFVSAAMIGSVALFFL